MISKIDGLCVIFICLIAILHFRCHAQTTAGYDNHDQHCTNPINEPGICIKIRSCRNLMTLFLSEPLSSLSKSFLRASQCGVKDYEPKVCCTSNNVVKETVPLVDSPGPVNRFGESEPVPDETACGAGPKIKIVNNSSIVESYELPWIANIEYATESGRGFHCGGVLISKRHVMTAAHCINGKRRRWRVISVRLGEWNSIPPSNCTGEEECPPMYTDYAVASTSVHDLYRANDIHQYNDIALLHLASDVNFTDHIQPICLPSKLEGYLAKTFIGDDMFITGWKKNLIIELGADTVSIRVKIISNDECKNRLQSTQRNPSVSQICDRATFNGSICNGDSGGPLMFQDSRRGVSTWYVSGIGTTTSMMCRKSNTVELYTKVSHYTDWISSHMGD